MHRRRVHLGLLALLVHCLVPLASAQGPEGGNLLRIGWSIYPGWQTNALMQMQLEPEKPSFLERRMLQFGGKVEITKFKEYIPSVTALAAGQLDACTMTLGEALALPTDSGVPVAALLVYDFSNGNDALLAPPGSSIAGLAGAQVYAEEFSVSQYLVWRAAQVNGLEPKSIRFLNTPGDEIPKLFLAARTPVWAATWNPHVARIEASGRAATLFTSREIPGEIIDLLAVRRDRIAGREKSLRAYLAAHFDVMAYFSNPATRARAIRAMTVTAEMRPEDGKIYEAMLEATRFFLTPTETVEFMESAGYREAQARVRTFLAEVGAFKGDSANYDVPADASFIRAATASPRPAAVR